ncbi:MAG: hypothetical protein WCR29_06350 [Bacteroidales bacterium]
MQLTKETTLEKLKEIKDTTFVKWRDTKETIIYHIWYKGVDYILTISPDTTYIEFANDSEEEDYCYDIRNVDFLIVLYELGYLKKEY